MPKEVCDLSFKSLLLKKKKKKLVALQWTPHSFLPGLVYWLFCLQNKKVLGRFQELFVTHLKIKFCKVNWG